MMKKMLAIAMMGIILSGCYMVPMALVGPATSGFSTASIMQSGLSTGANLVIKKATGRTLTEHVFSSIDAEILKQSYLPSTTIDKLKYFTNRHPEK
mgnify:CR=1 FL=1|tara:strand:- start:4299 stop:4586 length:288 start_codon:yes stop_codon:yes gene_type:complete